MGNISYKYFLAVVEEMNITKAAQRLYISQQSLSQHIAKLENKFGVELFYRSHPLVLTYAGERLVKKLTCLLDLERQINTEMQDILEENRGRLAIGISFTRGKAILPEILPLYHELYPGIELRCYEGNSEELEQKLLQGQIDIMIDSAPVKSIEIEMLAIATDRLVIVVNDSILCKYCPDTYEYIIAHLDDGLDVTLFQDCPLLCLSGENRIRTIIDEHLRQKAIKPNIIMMSENVETLHMLAVKGMGLTFCPQMLLPAREKADGGQCNDRAYYITLNDRSTDSTMIVAYKKGRYLSKAAKNLIELLQRRFG